MGRFSLIRLNSTERTILEDGVTYHCGRDRAGNEIVCNSLIVSRKHCIFQPSATGITVYDLKSGNGVFVNYQKLTPFVPCNLRQNDKIGLGISGKDVITPEHYVFQVYDSETDANRKRGSESAIGPIALKKIKTEEIVIDDDDEPEIVDIDFEPNVSNCAAPLVPEVQKEKPVDPKLQEVPKATPPAPINGQAHWLSQRPAETERVVIKYECDDDIEDIFLPPSPQYEPIAGPSSANNVAIQEEEHLPMSYSADNIVELRTGVNDVFPSSQLFDQDDIDENGDDDGKMETDQDSFRNEEEEPPLIVVSDEEEEGYDVGITNRWLEKIMSSQLAQQSIKREPQVSDASDENIDEAVENAAEVETDPPEAEVGHTGEETDLPEGEADYPDEEMEFSDTEADFSAEPGYLSEGEIESVKSPSKPIVKQSMARHTAQKLTDHPVKIKIKLKKQKKHKKKKAHRSKEKSIERQKKSSRDQKDAVNTEPLSSSLDVNEEEEEKQSPSPPLVPSTSASSISLQSLEAIQRRSAGLRIVLDRLSPSLIKKQIKPPHTPKERRHSVSCTVVSSAEPPAELAKKPPAVLPTKLPADLTKKSSTGLTKKPPTVLPTKLLADLAKKSPAGLTKQPPTVLPTKLPVNLATKPPAGLTIKPPVGLTIKSSAGPSGESSAVPSAGSSARPSAGSSAESLAGPSQSSDRSEALSEINIFSKTQFLSSTAHKNEDPEARKARQLERLKRKFSNPQLRSRPPSFVSNHEKRQIREDRKERLKQIADEKSKKNDEDQRSVKRVNKPCAKIKITQKTRGDFLVPDNAEAPTEPESIQPESKAKPEAKAKSVDKRPRKIIQISALPIIQKKSKISRKQEAVEPAPVESAPLEPAPVQPAAETDPQDVFVPLVDRSPNQKENEEPFAFYKPKKKVTFNANVRLREFEIDPGNTMTKCKGKDKMVGQFPNPLHVQKIPRLEEFLDCVLHWRPSWLFEQRSMNSSPPVVSPNTLKPLLTTYSSYEDYYKIMSPLLALELWHRISTDYEEGHRNQKHVTVFASIVANSVTKVSVPGKDVVLTSFMLEVLVNKRNAQKCLYPRLGDLVIMGLPLQTQVNEGKPMELFAYISGVQSTYVTRMTRYNPGLVYHVNNPYMLLTYTVTTKLLNVAISTDAVLRIKTVSYLRSNMRTVQALQSLPMSQLLKPILKPSLDSFQLPTVGDYDAYQFVTGDRLNDRQKEIVLQIARAAVQDVPKICLIQGPPGTGKSKVITNAVLEIGRGENNYFAQNDRRIMVCAPSNAATDEITIRLLEIRSKLPAENRFKMVRMGRTDSMNEAVKRISLGELTSREMKKAMGEHEKLESIELEISTLLAKINTVKIEIECPTISKNRKAVLACKLEILTAKHTALTATQNSRNQDPKQLERFRRQTEVKLLTGADIITCTLSSCYTSQMESIFGPNKAKINVCIVDEATQTTEAETLIPLMLGVTTFVLVGDPKQLPATVLSQEAKRYGMEQSLFARLQNAFDGRSRNPVAMLDTQYRMSFPIAFWPNKYFYDNCLKNSANIHSLPFHFYKVFNLASVQDQRKFSNTDEANFVANVIFTLLMHGNLDKLDFVLRIGIITPYNDQRMLINTKLKERLAQIPERIRQKAVTEVNTVDSFQGQERDVVVMSCVRSSGIGFLSDPQRLCVALTRAKHSLILCGNFKTFERDQMWNALLLDAKSRGNFIDVDYKASPEQIKRYVIR